MAWNNASKATSVFTNQDISFNAAMTWDEADFDWDSALGSWDESQGGWKRPTKSSSTFTNETMH